MRRGENKGSLSAQLIILNYIISRTLHCEAIILCIWLSARVLYSGAAAFFQLFKRVMSWSDKVSPVLPGLRVRASRDMRSIALHRSDYCALVSLIVHFGEGLMLDSVVDAPDVGAFFEFLGKGGVLLENTAVVVLGGQ